MHSYQCKMERTARNPHTMQNKHTPSLQTTCI